MLYEIKLPVLGENVPGADVAQVLVETGDSIKKDQPLLDLESEKAFMEFPSPVEGTVKEIKVRQGEKIKTGQLLFIMETLNVDTSSPQPETSGVKNPVSKNTESKNTESKVTESKIPTPEIMDTKQQEIEIQVISGNPVHASPSTKRLAREFRVDLQQVTGSGPDGYITNEDVLNSQNTNPQQPQLSSVYSDIQKKQVLPDLAKWGPVHNEPLTSTRGNIASQMSLSWNTIPHVTQFDQADITRLEEFRKSVNLRIQDKPSHVTITTILIKVTALALKNFNMINASVDIPNDSIVFRDYIHMGVAVETDRGLLTVVVKDADQKGILQIAREMHILVTHAREKKISLEEIQGASFTITNLGALGTTHFTPIINWPQSGILGIGKSDIKPVFDGETFLPRLILPLSITYDHRLIDGAYAAQFLRWISMSIEEPMNLQL